MSSRGRLCWNVVVQGQGRQLLVADLCQLAATVGVGFADEVALLRCGRIVQCQPGPIGSHPNRLAMPADQQDLDGRNGGRAILGPAIPIDQGAEGRREVGPQWSDQPVGKAADRQGVEALLVVNRHVEPVVLNQWLGLHHHALVKGAGLELAALPFMTSNAVAGQGNGHGLLGELEDPTRPQTFQIVRSDTFTNLDGQRSGTGGRSRQGKSRGFERRPQFATTRGSGSNGSVMTWPEEE